MCKCTPRTLSAPPARARVNFRTVFAGRVRFGGIFWRSLRATTKKRSSTFLERKRAPPDKILRYPQVVTVTCYPAILCCTALCIALEQTYCVNTLADISEHADVLRALYDKVSSTIDAQSVARNMFQSNALTLKELQSVQSKHKGPVKAAEQLLNIVMNQSGNVYSCFLEALKKTGHQPAFEVIVYGSYKGRRKLTQDV